MKLKFLLTKAFLISLLSIIAFGSIAYFVRRDDIVAFDRPIISFVQGLENPALTPIMKFFTWLGSTTTVIVLSLLIIILFYTVLRHRFELILFVWVMAGSTILNQVLKALFHRERPTFHRLIEELGYSFPSGHSMGALSLYGVVSFLLWRHISTKFGRGLLVAFSTIFILAIGISRIYLGVHYPSDVLAAYFASAFWLIISISYFQRYMKRRSNRTINHQSSI
ncbi:phosphatase PAP2 family protein [Priestia koreensis]|uniref:phosphatase PAP2 family protein n=1 Tax=Priestia koreensis TaxID=284581 RepID=UPI001F596174|nr:phosphatase PAP2 family protein [Priestia koreensis]UNL86358.1 phosphatase PAP2 family protein [Priestia koreensis]